MSKQLKRLTIAFIFIALAQLSFGQDNSEQAKIYFGKALNEKDFIELCKKSLPTIDDCKSIFNGTNADVFYRFMEDAKSQAQDGTDKPMETFVDLKVESFTTEDVLAGNGNYAGGMNSIAEKLQLDITFYKISLLREKDAEYGLAFKYWVYVNGRWVLIPKPWQAFQE